MSNSPHSNKEKRPLSKAYEASEVEKKWYHFWSDNGFFKPEEADHKGSYCMVMPPPNVTGALHMGHALNMTLQDILTRWKRMSGYSVLWVPGTDHAGISTQTVVERHLIQTEGKRRVDYQRDEFLKHVWRWKEENQNKILGQLKRLGASCDWSRLRFTMDDANNKAVRVIFKKLFDQGLIYRGDYLVNWDPVTMTALADDEVEYEEKQSFLWYFKYPLAKGKGHISIATTRPETMLGDTAVAVSPKDERYRNLIGEMIALPLTGRQIPIIADHMVDPEFGTGAVKVTPAHDPNDYQMGLAHKLPFINIMTPDGKINENGGTFQGLTMEDARKAVVNALQNLQLVEKIVPHLNRVGVSYRSKAVIEPYLSKQWFVKMGNFAKKLKEIVDSGQVRLIPENWNNTYHHWIGNLRDWCISRQLWWGHRIPIWYSKSNPDKMICYSGEGLPEEVQRSPEEWQQDEDVLDTWFSSSLWPFSTLGWPEETSLLKQFYPNSTLVTGNDILFFWVARMILMGDTVMGTPPFPETFLHGLIFGKSYWKTSKEGAITYITGKERLEYDLGTPLPKEVNYKWEKMSKSKGNVIDPIEIIDEYGTDAMRMALCSSASHAREIDLERRRFEEFRNFANKIWNGARFVLMNLCGEDTSNNLTASEFSTGIDEKLFALEDKWILSALSRTVQTVNDKLASYTFDQAALEAYNFFWKDFCSSYLEISKPILFGKKGTPQERKNKQKLLLVILTQAIRLLHPMAPFITEELFQILKDSYSFEEEAKVDSYTRETINALQKKACIIAPYPTVMDPKKIDPLTESHFKKIEEVVYAIRNLRGEMKLSPGVTIDVHFIGALENEDFCLVESNQHILPALIKISDLHFHQEEPLLGFASIAMVDQIKIMVPLPEECLKQEEARLVKERDKVSLLIEKTILQLENPSFVERAPQPLIEKLKMQLENSRKEFIEIETKLNSFNK
ncbi:Valine--tRNA ligase [Chlamydiales bacterium STE3]|nr:Valine--tRNA ligase [Chlamydiales bacterium STE3]